MDQRTKDDLLENAVETATEFGFWEGLWEGFCGLIGIIMSALFD